MITMHATANDIERALHELQHLAANGEGSDARHAAQFLMALYEGHAYPLDLQDFANLCPERMRQALQLLTFLLTSGTSLDKFVSAEAMDQVKDNLSALRCQGFISSISGNGSSGASRPAPPPAPAARTLP